MPRFPPTICLVINPDVTFYSFILPVALLMALGVSLVVGMFCLLYDMNTKHATHTEKIEKGASVSFY